MIAYVFGPVGQECFVVEYFFDCSEITDNY